MECFHRLFAKQHGSFGKTPKDNDKIFAYKERTYQVSESQKSLDDKAIQGQKFVYPGGGISGHITFMQKGKTEPLLVDGQPLRLSLKASAYLVNSSKNHREPLLTGRAAPDKQAFFKTMNQLVSELN